MLELITTEMEAAFEKAGYDKELAKVTLSNRPDLCEYQCNGAMAGAKKYKKAPFMIAEDVAVYLKESSYFETVEVVKPGFINLKLAPQSVADYLNQMSETEKLGVEEAEEPPQAVRAAAAAAAPQTARNERRVIFFMMFSSKITPGLLPGLDFPFLCFPLERLDYSAPPFRPRP